MRKGFWVITFFLFAAMGRMQVSAQVPMPLDATGRNSPTLPGFPAPDQNLEGEEQEGTTKKKEKEKKPRKPLESYFFNDSVRARENFVWHIDLYRNNMSIRSVDTLLNIFQVDYPYMRQDVGSAYLGNLGGAAVPLNYFTRPEYRDFEFAEAYDVYFTTPERAPFFNVKHPFTQLSYYSAGQKKYAEESLYISHAQNVSPSSGFNLEYKSRGTMGIYEWQKARQKNLSLAFSHTGKKYTFHGGYIYNGAQMRENGGVTDDWFVTDTVMELATGIPMSLLDAQNQIKQNTYYMVHSYGIPLRKLSEEDFSIADRSTLYVGLSSMYTRIKKLYTDTYAKCDTSFYDNWFINSKASHDSIFETLLSNRASSRSSRGAATR